MTTPTSEALLRGQRALITGGAGFIGSHLGAALRRAGCQVVVLDDLSGGFRENLPAGAEFMQGSILDPKELDRAISGCTLVFHQAALVSVPESVEHPDRCTATNIAGTERVLDAARRAGVRRVMFAASAAAYGPTPKLPSSETDTPDCVSPYAMSKVAGEMLLRVYSSCYGLSTVSLRYFNVYGPRQNPNSPYAAAISKFSQILREGKDPVLFGDGGQTRDFVSVHDIVRANLLAATSARPLAGEVVNIGTGKRQTLLEVLRLMGDALGRSVKPTFGPDRAGDVRHSVANISRARELLGYEPSVEFAAGIRELLTGSGSLAPNSR